MNTRLAGIFALCIGLLTGCASSALKDGQRLLAEERYPEAVARLEQAVQDSPADLSLRQFYHRQRDFSLARLVGRADAARSSGRRDLAEAAYRDMLQIDRSNPRARGGLAQIEAERRLEAVAAQAERMLQAGQLTSAEGLLRGLLTEQPNHAEARRLMALVAEKAKAAVPPPGEMRTAMAKSATFEFRDTPIKSVFDFIGRSHGLNFVFDKDVKTDVKVTLIARDTNLDDFLRLLLLTNQLERKALNDNSVLIYPNTPAKQRDYQELVSRSFFLANADARQTMNMIKGMVKTKDIYVDEKLNLLVMKDTPEAVRYAEQLVALQDVPEPEVMLEVEILEVTRSRLAEIGLSFPDRISASLGDRGSYTLSEWKGRNGNFVTFNTTDPALALNLKDTDSDTNLLANPRIRVRNREKAKIHIGDKVPVITSTAVASAGVSTSVNYLDVGLKLDVEPNIFLDGEVAIKVGLEVSSITQKFEDIANVLAYAVGTRTAATTLRLRDGETQVLAGLIQDDDRRNASRVPGLGDLPILGRLFANHADEQKKTEVVLLITPRILRSLPRPERDSLMFPVGTEGNVGGKPLTIGKTGPRALAVSSSAPPSATRGPATPAAGPATPESGEPATAREAAPVGENPPAAPGYLADPGATAPREPKPVPPRSDSDVSPAAQ